MIGFGKIGQNGRFWAKITKFWSKKGQKFKFQIFPEEIFFAIFLKTKKLVSIAKSYERIWRNWSKWPFLGQNGHFGPFLAQNGENKIFSPKIETVTF